MSTGAAASPGVLFFEYTSLSFDTTAQHRVKDAFEVSVVDADGKSLVPTYASPGRDAAFNALRLRTTRDLWDPAYVQESWIRHDPSSPVALLPRVKGWIAKHNPQARSVSTI